MANKINFIFTVLFIVVPFVFLISFFIWRLLMNTGGLIVIAADCLPILGIYYFLTSIVFFIMYIKKIDLKNW